MTPPRITSVEGVARKDARFRERQERLLEAARRLLLAEGYHGVTMEALAAAINYSKGTVYQHFKSREDVLMALAAETAKVREDLFERASAFQGRPRERMAAIGEAYDLFVRKYPSYLRTEQILHASSMREKCALDRTESVEGGENRCGSIIMGIVRDAVSQVDLRLPADSQPGELMLGLWSLSFGSHFLASSGHPQRQLGITDLRGVLRRNCHALMDGWGWKPLSSEWDYDATYRRIAKEVFPEGARR